MKRIVLIALNMAIYCDLWNGIIANEAKSKEEEKLFVSGHKIIVGHKVIWKCLHLLGKVSDKITVPYFFGSDAVGIRTGCIFAFSVFFSKHIVKS